MSAPGGVDGKTHAMDPVRSSEPKPTIEAMYVLSGSMTSVLQVADTEHSSEIKDYLHQMQVLASIEALD